VPLGADVRLVGRLSDADEAARGVERAGRGLRGAGERGRKVELAPQTPGDRREQALAGQRLLERDARAQLLERDGRLRGERLHHREILVREDSRFVERRDRDHGGHSLLHQERDEGGALGADGLDEAAADDAGARRIVDRQRCRLEDRARDPRRLAAQIDAQLVPPVDVLAERAREVSRRLPPVVGHEGQSDEADGKERRDLVQQRPRDAFDVGAARQLVREAADALEFARGRAPPTLPRPAATEDRGQEKNRGRGAAERANRQQLFRGPHWADRLYGAKSIRARKRPRT
jgi:hypothetical protein